MGKILTMVLWDLRQKITDGSVIAFAVLVPLALIWVMNLVFAGATGAALAPVTVGVSVPQGDQMGAVIPQALRSVPEQDGMQITVEDLAAAEVPARVADETVDLGIVVPDGFTADLVSGAGPEVTVTRGDGAGITGQVVSSILDGTLNQLTASTRAAAAGQEAGLAPDQLAGIARSVAEDAPQLRWTEGQAASEQLGPEEALVAGQAGMFLLFTVGFGVLALVTEREQGTLARLTSMPMPPWFIVLAKGLVSFILGLVATAILLVAGGLLFDNVDFGSPVAVAVLVVLVVAATTSIMFVIAKVARTAEQASIAQAVVAVTLGMSGGAFFPVTTSGIVGQLLAVNPVQSFVNGLGITAGGGGIAELGPTAVTLSAFTAVLLLGAWLVPGRKDAL